MAQQPTREGDVEAPQVPRRGNLAPIALGLGIPGLLLGMVPLYGIFFAMPLSVGAVVLGLTARGRPEEHRGQATAGLVTGGLGLLLMVGWIGWFAWTQSGFGAFSSSTSVQVESGSSSVAVPAPQATGPQDGASVGPDDPAVVPPDAQHGELRTGLSGEAEVVLGGRSVTMALPDCALSRRSGRGLLARGDGPDGRLVIMQAGEFSGGLVVVVEPDDGPSGTYAGDQHGMSGSGRGGLLTERHRFTLEGQLRDLHEDGEVAVEIVVTCS